MTPKADAWIITSPSPDALALIKAQTVTLSPRLFRSKSLCPCDRHSSNREPYTGHSTSAMSSTVLWALLQRKVDNTFVFSEFGVGRVHTFHLHLIWTGVFRAEVCLTLCLDWAEGAELLHSRSLLNSVDRLRTFGLSLTVVSVGVQRILCFFSLIISLPAVGSPLCFTLLTSAGESLK